MEFSHPELLSTAEILNILQKRFLKIPNMEQLCRDELISIYKKFALPYDVRHSKKIPPSKSPENMDCFVDINDEEKDCISHKRRNCTVVEDLDSNISKIARLTLLKFNLSENGTKLGKRIFPTNEQQFLLNMPSKKKKIIWT